MRESSKISGLKILAVIPARSGSKSVPNKNVRLIAGKPLMAYSIEHAFTSKYINRVILSTDSLAYAQIGTKYGAEVPFLRPSEFAQDQSIDIEVFKHCLEWLQENENYVPDICVHLRPTHPVRNPADIDRAIELLVENDDVDSVRSIVQAPESVFKMWFVKENNVLEPAVKTDIPEAYNMPRQALPVAYVQNASIDVVRKTVITEKNSMTGSRILGYLMEENFDIDTDSELETASTRIANDSKKVDISEDDIPKKTFCFDIDGVIAGLVPDNNYKLSEPIKENIELVNKLYEKGHRIVLHTARGSATGINWEKVTKEQMDKWSLKYHDLKFGKPAADYYIDDKLVNIKKDKGLA